MSEPTVSNPLHKSLPRKPLPRYKRERAAGLDLPGFALQKRDLALLEDIWLYRWLTTGQLELLRGSDPDPALRFVSRLTLTRRLKLLFHHRYLRRIARPLSEGSREPVYVLDGEGAKALRRQYGDLGYGDLTQNNSAHADSALGEVRPVTPRTHPAPRAPSQQPKAAALDHLLAINQFRVSLTVACRATVACRDTITCHESVGTDRQLQTGPVSTPQTELLNWHTSGEVKFKVERAGRGERTAVVTLLPDGFFTLRARGQRLFCFLEVDLGSEPARTLADKCASYYVYWQSGGFARDFSVPPHIGFRVLFVAPTLRRAQTIDGAIRTLPAGRTMFLTTTEEHIQPSYLLGPIFRSGGAETRVGTEAWVSLVS